MSTKEIILSNIIGLNPTGTLDFNGTYSMNGNNNIVQNSTTASKENLDKAQTNKIICSNVEKFENYMEKHENLFGGSPLFLNTYSQKYNDNIENLNTNYKKNIFLIFIIFLLLIIISLI